MRAEKNKHKEIIADKEIEENLNFTNNICSDDLNDEIYYLDTLSDYIMNANAYLSTEICNY